MPTRASEKRGVGPAAKQVAEHASTLARLELELAGLEVKRKVAALALVVSTWLALLIVFGALLLLAVILGLVGMSAMRRGTPPVPKQAIREAKLTTEAIRGDGAH